MDQLKKRFQKEGISESSAESLCYYFEKRNYKRGMLLIKPGSIVSKVYFIESGTVTLGIETDKKSVARHVVSGGEFITCLESFHRQIRTNEFLKATSDCVVYEAAREDINQAMQQFPVLQTFYQNLIFDLLVRCQKRITQLTSLDSASYYSHLRDTNPEIIQQMHQYDLASYIGIKPESLSRLRAKKK